MYSFVLKNKVIFGMDRRCRTVKYSGFMCGKLAHLYHYMAYKQLSPKRTLCRVCQVQSTWFKE